MKNIYVVFTGLIWLFVGLLYARAGTPSHSPYPERAAGAPAPTFTFTKTDVTTCNGATTGSITVTASGGAGNYTYSKDNGATYQASNQFAGLPAGTYQVVVKDGSNTQSAAQAVTINQPDALIGRATSVTSTCPGLSTGAISFSASGGTAPYQFAINNGTYQSSNVFTGLAAGNYLLSVKDANGCVISPAYYQVTAPTAPTVTPVVTDISCNGRQDGAIRVDLTGGVNQGATTISIDNGATYINNTVFSALSAGTYRIIVKYGNNCLTPVKEATVNQPTALSFTTQITGTINCNGGQTGAIQVTASGGTGAYRYSKDNGFNYQDGNQFNELSAGTYRIAVTDSKNCTASVQPVTISQPTALTYTLTKTDVSCYGGNDGSVSIEGQGGTGPYQYYFTDQVPAAIRNPGLGTASSTKIAARGARAAADQHNNLTAQTYYFTVSDANGCYASSSTTVNQPSPLTVERGVVNVLCNGSSTGRITLTTGGGTPPYQYSRDGGTTFQDNAQFTGLPAGTYSVVVKDKNNCRSETQSVEITQPAALAFTTSKTDAICAGGNTGSIVVTASGGTAPYQYSKDNGTTFQNASSFTGLTAGTYQVLVKDANNCVSAAQSVSIGQPAAVAFTTTKTDVVGCNGNNTGSITATANGGTGAYQYSKDNGTTFQTSNSFASLSAGTYQIVVKDANGCVSAAQSIVITQPPTLALSTNAMNVSCFSGTNGSITFTASGGTGAYQYSKDNGQSFQASNSFTGLTAGTYQVLVKDANNCVSATQPVTITQPTALALTIEQANVSCFGAATGTIVAGASGGTPAYQYSKDNGATYQGSNQFSNLTAGSYSVRIKDANNCLSGTQTVTITQPAALSLSAAQTNVTTCFGGNNGSITVTATGGTGAYQYSKDNGGSFQSASTFTGLTAGSYQVLVKDANNCVSTAQTLVITQPTAVSFTTAKTDVTSCNGATTGAIVVTASGGTGAYQYSKDNGASFQTSNSFTGLGANSYQVVVKDANGCLAPVQTVVINQPSPVAGSVVSTTQTCPGLSTGGLTASASGGTGSYQYALNNGTYQSGNVFTGLGVGNYTLSVKDANGCIYNGATYQITAPTAPTVTPTVTNLTCNGTPNGSIYVGTSGGVDVGQIYASINNGATYTTTIQFNNLAAGTYQVLVKYANNCLTSVQSVTVTQPAAVSISASVTSTINCYGNSTGAITVTASGGTAPYQYSKDNGASYQDTNLFGELTAGTYPIVVKDANGCVTPAQQVVLNQPTELIYTISKTDVSCFGVGNGTITVEAQGGTGPYEYAINREGLGATDGGNPGAGTSGRQFTNLAAGSYYVTITDANGCSVRPSLDISQPEALVFETSTSSVLCNGGSTGRITVTASGGTGGYQYSKDNGTTYQSASQFGTVAAGVYNIVVKDANNCVTTAQSVTVVQPAVLTASTSKTNVTTCFGGNNGSIAVTASGGTAPYQYSKDNGGTFQPGNSFANLTAGTYAMVVKDANGCATAAQNVPIDQPAAVSFTTTKVNVPGCNGDNTGSITVTASGGTGAYQYSKDNGATFQVANQFAGLTAGSYQVVVKDGNGCVSAAQTVVITQPAQLAYTVAVTNVSCFGGANGSITVTASGGTAPYQYSKDNGTTFQAGNSFTGLGANSFQVMVKDASGCRLEATGVTITQPNVLNLSVESVNLNCNGAATGSITVTGSGGVPAYQYSKDNGTTYQAGNQFAGLAAGTYSVRIKDANGCVSAVRSVGLSQPAALSLSVAKTNVTSCNGDATGSITVTGSGGAGNYTYSKDNGASFQTSNQFAGLAAGVYTVLAKDANGCVSPAQSVTISQPSALSLSVAATDTRCFGDNTGALTITASGGTGPYSYTHDRTEGFRASNRFENLSAGVYNVRVRDANGCVSMAQSVTINQPDVLTMRASSSPVTCFGSSTGSISVTANGGTASYQYSKDNGATYQSTSQFTGLGVGTYSVIVKDANNCVTTAQSITITQPAALAVTISKTDIVSCLDGNTGTISLSATGGTTPYQYSKDNGATYQADNSFTKLSAGVYQIVVKDANNCVTAAQSVTIAQPQAITLRLAKTDVTSCNGDATGSLSLTASGGTGAYQYSKDNGASFQTGNQFGSLTAGVYTVLAKDANGCASPAQSVTISQPSALSLSVAATDTRCFGDNTGALTITASGGTGPYSYTHDRTEGFRTSNRFENLSAGVYNVRVQDANGCVSMAQSVTINQPQPLTFVTSQTNVSCAGTTTGSISFSATGGTGAYQYSIDNGNRFQTSAQFTNLPAGSYPVLVKDANGCLSEAPSVVLTQPAILAVTASKTNIVSCSDGNTGTISLSATGGTTPYRYSKDNGATYQESPQFAGLSAGPYRLVVNDANGCQAPISVTVVSPCCLSATANPATIAYGQSTTLTATGCSGTISWAGGPQNSSVYVVRPSITTSYTATCSIPTSGSPVTCTSVVTVTVNQPVCTLTTSASPTTITNGQSSTLTASGCDGTVNWTGGPGNSTVYVVNPTQTTSYTATCLVASAGTPVTCTSVVTVTVNQPVCALTTSASPTTITNGQSSTLTASGCTGTVSWSGGPANSAVYVVNPAQTTSYTAICTIATSGSPVTCQSIVTVTVNQPVCALTTSASPATVVVGQSTTLTASGCTGTISWRGIDQGGSSIVVSPSQTTSYTATCTIPTASSPVTCTSVVTVTVNQQTCTLTTSASPATITNGQSSTLTASGCSGGTVSWSGGPTNSTMYVVNPAQTTSYTATCTIATLGNPVSCTSVVTVTVNQPVCTLTTSASPTTITNGQSTTLTASGCTGTVSWNGGPQTSNVYVVNPAQTTTYTATCTIATSGSPVTCQSTVTVTVNQPVCALITSASPTTITNGQSSTLTASGCVGTVNWTGGPTNSTVYVVNPTQTTSYTATCTIATSGSPVTCTSVVMVTVTQQIVCALTTTANPTTITNGQSATLTASGCTGTVSWSGGPANAAVYVVAPTQTTSYTATCNIPASGAPVTCTSVVTVVVNQPVCTIAAQASSNAIFNGQSVTLTATGCANGTISWSGSPQTGSTLIVSPGATTTYVATCTIPTSGSPVICTAPVSVTVVNRPECTLQVQSNPSTVFAGDPVTLTATGCTGTLQWSSGQSESIITVNPTGTTTYSAVCTTVTPAGSVSCLATTTVTVIAKPVCNLSLQASPTAIFNGQSATLTASGCEGGTISWNSQAGGGSRIIVSPTATTTYSATCTFTTLAGSVSCTAPVTVTVTQPMLQITGSSDVLPLNAVTWAGTVTQNVGPFVWQYKTPTGDWQNFPTTFDNNPSILVSATSFLGSAAPTLINQAIQVRAFSPYLISNVLTVTIRQQNPTIASLVTTKALCANTATGSFTLTVGRNLEPGESAFRARIFTLTNGGETLSATYTFTGTTFASPAVFAKGAYRVRLQAVIGSGSSAESTQDFTIEDVPALTLTATKTDILCFNGRIGTINLLASGGVGPYQYAINGGAFQPFQAATQQQIANLAAGVYSVQLRDNNACSSAQPISVTIAQPTASLTITSGTVKNPTGFQGNDGTITLQLTGGTPDYSFAWSVPNPAVSTQPTAQGVTHTITNLGDGNYTVVVTDKAGCTTQASYSLTQPSSILIKTTIVKAISCAGGANGIVQVDASGGVPRLSGDAYAYDWKVKGATTSISQTSRLTNATSTTYTVTVTDGNGVAKAFDVYLPEPLPVVVSVASLTNVACFGTATGGASLSIQGGVVPYVTRWNTQQIGLALTNMQAGRYVAVVTDANSCQAQASVQIQQPQALSATLASVNPSCYDSCNGQIATTLTGGTAPYAVSWTNSASQALSLTGLCSGSYTVNIKDANGCAVTQTTSLTRPVQKQIVLRTNTFICAGQTVDLDATITDGISYTWTYPDGTTRTTPVVSVTSAGRYQVTATDKNGCTVTAQTSLSASGTQAPTLAFAVASQIGVGEPLIAVNITNPRPTQTSWTIPASASLVSSSDDRLELVFKNTGTYPITMNGVQGQCEFKTTKMVTAVPASTVVTTAQTTPFIQELTLLPNPNAGTFKVRIRLAGVSDVKIRVKPLLSTGTDIYQQSAAGQQDYELSVSIPVQNLQTGNYLLTLETAKAIQTVKLLIVL